MEGNEPTEKGRNTVFSVSCSPCSDPFVMIPSSITKLAISKPNWRSLLPALKKNYSATFCFRFYAPDIILWFLFFSAGRQLCHFLYIICNRWAVVRISTENTALPSALARETKARVTPMNANTPT